MPTNVNWDRWIHSSINRYFSDIAATNSLPKLFEGIDTRTATFMEGDHRCEIRATGPDSREPSKDYFELRVNINLFFTSRMNITDESSYRQNDLLGIFLQAMQQPIDVFRRGDGPDDDDSLVSCLIPDNGKRGHIKVHHFGQMETAMEYKQAAIDGKYTMYLKV